MKAHLPEYLAEFLGTAIMMAVGIGAVTLMWSQGSVMRELIPSDSLRRLLTGILFASGGTAVVLSPLGQRSGGHLNPAVTFAFWWKGQVSTADAFAYVLSQVLGALLGVCVVAAVAGSAARSVQLGLTLPGEGYSVATAFFAEVLITFLLVFLIVYCVNDQRFARRTPYLAGGLVAFLVFVEAPVSGTSLNPARSLAPAMLMHAYADQWLYLLGPLLGALAAVALFSHFFGRDQRAGCAKLFHTERYKCIFTDCVYTRVAAGTVVLRQGEVADKAYVIERGTLEVRRRGSDGAEQVLALLGPGDWVGEMALLLGLPRSATVVAAQDSELREVTVENFAHVIAEHPTETMRLLRQLCERIDLADRKLDLGQAGTGMLT
ncbi:MAG: aquaporin [Nevskia sp.]|nr:aquaporin [Nevskia sp.]